MHDKGKENQYCLEALFTFAVSFRSTAKGSPVAFCSSDIAGAMPSSQTTTSDLFRPTEILTVKVNKACLETSMEYPKYHAYPAM